MKNYVKELPFILFPYLFIGATFLIDKFAVESAQTYCYLCVFILYLILIFRFNIRAIRGTYTISEISLIHLSVRVVTLLMHIDVIMLFYHFATTTYWDFDLSRMVAVLFDIMLTGLISLSTIGCNIALSKKGIFSKRICIFFGFLNFVPGVDTILAVLYVFAVKKTHNFPTS